MNKTFTVVIIVVVALLIGAYAGYAYEKSKLVRMMETQRMDLQKQIDDTKMMNENKQIAPTDTMMESSSTVTPTEEVMMKK